MTTSDKDYQTMLESITASVRDIGEFGYNETQLNAALEAVAHLVANLGLALKVPSYDFIQAKTNLEYIRAQLRAERVSMTELAELQGLAERGYIEPDDVELLEAAGVPEFVEGLD